jgi:hypothetical protein
MTSFRQIEANRRNALRSTGPNTEDGKRRSRRNALRHGLSAETVVEIVEDIDDYKGFEAAVIADYDAHTAVERELVLRLASLLWRLRRATAIETELLTIQAEILRDRRHDQIQDGSQHLPCPHAAAKFLPLQSQDNEESCGDSEPSHAEPDQCNQLSGSGRFVVNSSRDLALCFQRLTNFDNGAFERLGRYESALMRQMMKTVLLLHLARRRYEP